MPISNAKKRWTLSVTANPGTSLPASIQALNHGTLHIFGQHGGPNSGDDFNILSIKLINGVNSNFQFAPGAIDSDNIVEFVFLSNGNESGDQFVFRGGHLGTNAISGGTIVGPPRSAGDEDIGTWTATGGGGVDPRKKSPSKKLPSKKSPRKKSPSKKSPSKKSPRKRG